MNPVMTAETYQEQVLNEIRSAETSRQDVMYVALDDFPSDPSGTISTLNLTRSAVLLETLPDHDRPVVLVLPDPRLLAAERLAWLEPCLTL